MRVKRQFPTMANPTQEGRVPAARQAYLRLREAIIGLALAPGQGLSEKEISERLKVSRQPVREAFIRLSEEGLVEIRPQIGTFVSRLRVAEVAELDELAQILEAHEQVEHQGDSDGGYRQDEAFHLRLIELSGYPGIWRMVRQARAHMVRLRNLSIAHLHTAPEAVDQHRRIFTALQNHDPEAAAESLKAHIEQNAAYMERLSIKIPQFFETREAP
jgi:DNA-binding GntR family transcriptional regulator